MSCGKVTVTVMVGRGYGVSSGEVMMGRRWWRDYGVSCREVTVGEGLRIGRLGRKGE